VTETCSHQGKKYKMPYCGVDWNQNTILLNLLFFDHASFSIELFYLPTLMHNSLFINNTSVILLSSTCFEHYKPIFKGTNCILTASGIGALCKRLHSTPVKSPLLTSVLCSRLQRATKPDAVRIQFVLLKMGMLMLETCRG
jgi:hypothetical protein